MTISGARVSAEQNDRLARAAVFFLFFLSGAAALIYEVVWLRLLILILGSTQFAVGTILTAFMGGLALGAFVFGRIIDNRGDPLKLYGVLEILIGLYALAVPFLFDALVPVYRAIWSTFAPEFLTFSLLRFCFVLMVLIVPTSLMGGTLPILSKFVTRREESIGLSVGSLYALNTLGAVVGTASTGFFLVPYLGTDTSIAFAAAMNMTIGAVALVFAFSAGKTARTPATGPADVVETRSASELTPTAADVAIPAESRLLLWVVAGTGFIAMTYEVAWTRVLALIIGSSVYAFTIMLTTFLVGLAAGAAAVSLVADRLRGRRAVAGVVVLLVGTALAAFGTMLFFNELPYLFARLFQFVRGQTGMTFLLKFVIAFVVMLPPTLFIGGIFPLVMRHYSEHLSSLGRSVGTVYMSNTAGTIAGSVLAGFFLIPLIGIQGSILLAILLDLLLAMLLVAAGALGRPLRRRVSAGVALMAIGAILFFAAPGWNARAMNSGVYQHPSNILKKRSAGQDGETAGELRFYKEGLTVSVMVVEVDREILLSVNGKVDASSLADLHTQLLLGHIPALLVERPGKALVIGYGSGITVGAITRHRFEEIAAVEIEPVVLEASHYFDRFNHRPMEDPRVRIIRNDARNLLLVSDQRYDVIVSEPSNPWMTVAANLFTREFFELGRKRLEAGGIFAQWVQIYKMAAEDLKALVRTFHAVFPHVMVFNSLEGADLVLIGSATPLSFDLDDLRSKMSVQSVASDLARIRVRAPQDLMSYFVFGDGELQSFSGEGALNTDDNALIEFHAPKSLLSSTRAENMAELERVMTDATIYTEGLDEEKRYRSHISALVQAFLRRGWLARAGDTVQMKFKPTD